MPIQTGPNKQTHAITQDVYIAGTFDPTVEATYGIRGTVYVRVGALGGALYQKADDGTTTNWVLNSGIVPGNISVEENGLNVESILTTLNFLSPITATAMGGGVVDVGLNYTGTPNRVAIWDSLGVLTSSANFTYQDALQQLGMGAGNTINVAALDSIALQGGNTLGAGQYNLARGGSNVSGTGNSAAGPGNVIQAGVLSSVAYGSNNTIQTGASAALAWGDSNVIGPGGGWGLGVNNVVDSGGGFGVNNTVINSGVGSVLFGFGHTTDMPWTYAWGQSNTGSIASGGSYGYMFGDQNTVSGTYNYIFGVLNQITASTVGLVLGSNSSITSSDYSAAFGDANIITTGSNNYAFGNLHNVTGNRNFAFGRQQTLSNDYNAAFGNLNTLSGQFGFAVGANMTITGSSYGFGSGNQSGAQYAMLVGQGNTYQAAGARGLLVGADIDSDAIDSVIGGNSISITGNQSRVFAFGESLATSFGDQFIIGRANIPDTNDAFQVGINGANGFQVGKDGLIQRTQGGDRTKSVLAGAGPYNASARTDYIIYCDQAATTVNLPAGVEGQTYFIKDVTGNINPNHNIVPNGAETIEGAASLGILTSYRGYWLNYNATNTTWYITGIV